MEDDEVTQQHLRDFEWHEYLIQSKSYNELIEYLLSTLVNNLPHISYPTLTTLQIVITIATISPHYYQFKTHINNENLHGIPLKAVEVLNLLISLASSDDLDDEYSKPSIDEKISLRNELFKVLDFFENDDNVKVMRQQQRYFVTPELLPAEEESEEDSDLEKTPLKRQMDQLFDTIRDESVRRLDFKEDENIFGNVILHELLEKNFWKLIRWSLKNASSSDLKSNYIWKTWKPILNFFIELLILQFDAIEDDLPFNLVKRKLKKTFIYNLIKSCSYDEKASFDEYLTRIFINGNMNTEYISPIYTQELKQNNRFILTLDLQDEYDGLKLGLSSLQIRKKFIFLAYRFICANFVSTRDTKFHNAMRNSKESLLHSFFNKLQFFLLQLSYLELREFFNEDPDKLLKNFKLEFLATICINLLEYYSCVIIDDDGIEPFDFLYEDNFNKFETIQKCDPRNFIINSKDEVSFTIFFEIYQKIVLCISVLLNIWFKLNQVEPKNWNLIYQSLSKNDELRQEILKSTYKKMKQQAQLTPREIDAYNMGYHNLFSLKEMFISKFGENLSKYIVEDSE